MLLVINSNNLHNKVLIVTGGRTGPEIGSDSTEVYDPRVGSWTAGRSLPRRMDGVAATTINDQVLIFGEWHSILDTNIITGLKYFQVKMTVIILLTPSCNTTVLRTNSQM